MQFGVCLHSGNFRIHAGHGTYLHPDERQFATPELIKTTCMVGPSSADEPG